MADKDYYKVLGVEPEASAEDIRKAYRRLAKQQHPDRHGGSKAAEERFKEVGEAYAVLGDPQKRKQYDQLRTAGMQGGSFGGFGSFEDMFRAGQPGGGPAGAQGFGGFGDLFSRMFGGARGAQHAPRRRGGDAVSSITIPFETAVHGGDVHVNIPQERMCPNCSGSGAAPGSSVNTCARCQGTGQVLAGQGGFSVSRPCPSCFGRGKIFDTPCGTCRGAGTVEENKRVKVTIPRGIGDGQKMRLAGMGQPGVGGGPPGDLLLEVKVAPHAIYRRKGRDIYSDAEIGMVDAALGTKIDVPTMHGAISLKVPPGTQPGQRLRIPGYGLETSDGRKGDHYVIVKVSIPRSLSPEHRRLLERLRDAYAGARN